MQLPFYFQGWLCGLALMGLLTLEAAVAQVPPMPVPEAESGPLRVPTPPLLPPPSPVDTFRQLLAMKPQERAVALQGRNPEQRKVIAAKLLEYDALPPEARELRLHFTQLRWHLLRLMRKSPTDRMGDLARVPELDRPLVEERLREWDQLSPEIQKQFLDNEPTLNLLMETQALSTPILSAERQKKLEVELTRWQSLPEHQRQELYDRFRQFFELNAGDQSKTLGSLSEAERRQMEKNMQAFSILPPLERSRRLESFHKLVSMPLEEQRRFLRSAARWQGMTDKERDSLRQMLNQLPPMPPLPPQCRTNMPPMPPGWDAYVPMPPKLHMTNVVSAATNVGVSRQP